MDGPLPKAFDLPAWRWILRHFFHLTLDVYRDGPMGVAHCDRCKKGYVYDVV
jgi:hypothetical protein